jgi:hypothetical protein
MKTTSLLRLVLLCGIAQPLIARDVYLVQGSADGIQVNSETTLWSSDVLLYNKGATLGTVTLLGMSNGGQAAGTVRYSFSVAPRQSASLERQITWRPALGSPLWVIHLEVPPELVVEDVVFIGSRDNNILASPTAQPRRYGKIRIPVFESLTPANEPQVHLESDLGDIPARINVGIYNASDRTATAQIETRQHCDDGVISHQTMTIAANTVVQAGPFQAETPNCQGLPRSIYTVVTVDAPSLTFVSALANSAIPTTSISIGGN